MIELKWGGGEYTTLTGVYIIFFVPLSNSMINFQIITYTSKLSQIREKKLFVYLSKEYLLELIKCQIFHFGLKILGTPDKEVVLR